MGQTRNEKGQFTYVEGSQRRPRLNVKARQRIEHTERLKVLTTLMQGFGMQTLTHYETILTTWGRLTGENLDDHKQQLGQLIPSIMLQTHALLERELERTLDEDHQP